MNLRFALMVSQAKQTPYERGYAAGLDGTGRSPEFPRGDASWAEKLYARGWSDGADARIRAARERTGA